MSDRTIVILQPGYLPWLGFFEQLYQSDVFVVYDDVQYDKNGWRNRNRIKTAQGWQWLTVPVLLKGQHTPIIKDIRIHNSVPWSSKHMEAIRQNYSKAPFFKEYFPALETLYQRPWEWLIELDMHFILLFAELLGLKREFRFASELGVTGGKTERLVFICRHLEGTRFYEGAAGQNYIDEALFAQHQVKLNYQRYDHPHYRQLHGEFIPYMSIIDLLFNHGAESLAVLTHASEVKV